MRVKCSSPAQSIAKTDGLKPGEGTASQEPPGVGSSPSSRGRLYPSAHSSPIVSLVSFPQFKASFPAFQLSFHLSLSLPCSESNPCLSLPSSLLLAIFTFFPLSYCLFLLLSPFCCHSIFLSPSFSPPLTPPFPSHSVSHSPSRMKVMKIIGLH